MSNTISSYSSAVPAAQPVAARTLTAASALPETALAADRVAHQGNQLPALLTLGAATAAQLVPGVVEAEGAAGIATAVGIGVRAAAANPVVSFAGGVAVSAIGNYAKTLVHDAAAHQPSFAALSAAGHSLDGDIRGALGIPPSEPR